MSILHNRFLTALLLLLLCGCNENQLAQDPLPYVFVNEQVFMNEVRALPLTTRDGAFIYISGGLKGIILYRKAPGQFIALERQSTSSAGCQVKVDVTQQYVVDTCNTTQYDFNGSYIGGTATPNLRQYNVNYDGVRIAITN
jgi:hypothetical protein